MQYGADRQPRTFGQQKHDRVGLVTISEVEGGQASTRSEIGDRKRLRIEVFERIPVVGNNDARQGLWANSSDAEGAKLLRKAQQRPRSESERHGAATLLLEG